MEKLAKCLMTNESFNIEEGKVYKLTCNRNDFTESYRLYYKSKAYWDVNTFQLNLHYFDFLLSEEETIDLIKNNLSISDDNIFKYSDISYINKYCMKYKGKIIFLYIENKYDIPCTLHAEICNNKISNYLTTDGLTNTCDFIKFLCENIGDSTNA